MPTSGRAAYRGAAQRHENQADARLGVLGWPPKRLFMGLALALLTALRLRGQDVSPQTPFPGFDFSSPSAGGSSSSVPRSSLTTDDGALTFKVRTDVYLESVIEPEALVRPLLGAAWDQAIGTPPQWGQVDDSRKGRRVLNGRHGLSTL